MPNEDLPPEPFDSEQPTPPSEDRHSRFHLTRGDWLLFAVVLLFYAATRLYGIADFPIYFFCDEAHQANLAHDLVVNDFHDEDGNLCPAYFRNVRVFNLGLSVWIHALPVTAFGKSIFAVRATSVVVGLFGTAALMLALKWFFGVRLWWTGGLVMAALPAWFLHSRTAFETAMMVGFYAMFVLAYLMYREVSAWWLAAAVVCGAATFYSYSNGQGVMLITCLLLLVVDWRYHWRVVTRHPRAAVTALVVLLLVAAPYVRFRYVLHPDLMELHFQDLASYWMEEIPTGQKIGTFAGFYLHGLSPGYWFTENVTELVRHRMLGYPYFPMWLAPAIILGLALSLVRSPRSPAHRLLLIGVLAAPFSASLVELRITRLLAMVVPATLSATVGLDQLRIWLGRRVPERLFSAFVGVALALATVAMTRDALVNGPRWFTNYGMHGMQWGAKEVFGFLNQRLATATTDQEIVISHQWANNTDAFGFFFLEPEELHRVTWATVDELLHKRRSEVAPTTAFVLTPDEFESAQASPKLMMDPTYTVIPNPNGQPGFYVVRLSYAPGAAAIFAAEREERRRLVESTVFIDGSAARIRYPQLDQGEIAHAFDGDFKSLARTLDGNPTNLVISFSEARPVSGLRLHLWTDTYFIEVQATRANGESVAITANHVSGRPPEAVEILFEDPMSDVTRIDLHIKKAGDVHEHMREIEVLR